MGGINFQVQWAIKVHALVDFFTKSVNTAPKTTLATTSWHLYMDGSSTKDRSRIDLIIGAPQGDKREHALEFLSKASNNEAEYESLITRIELRYIAWVDSVKAYLD